MHKSGLLVKNSTIDIAVLKNIITVACRVNEFKWATNQLAYYIKYVPKTIKRSVFQYNSGIIAFNQEKYDEALNHFNKVRKLIVRTN